MRFSRLILICLLAGISALTSAAAQPMPRGALIIDESDPSGGAPTTFSTTLRQTLDGFAPHVAVYGETLNLKQFAGPAQENILSTYLRAKYGELRFGVVIAVGLSAFDFVNRWRSELWPGVPVVFAAIDEVSAAQLKLDSDVTGLVMRRSIKSMMTAARMLVPDLKAITIMGGAPERDVYRRQYQLELPKLAAEIGVTNLTGLPLSEQIKRSAKLPTNSAIFYTPLFIDDAGTRYSSSETLAAIAETATRPIIIDVDSLIGRGATGGFVLNNVAYGKEVASLALRILNGERASSIPVAVSEFTRPVFDWRRLQRWNIAETSLPEGSEIRYREATAWEKYRWQIMLIAIALLGQFLLIAGLFYQHRRRREAELESRRQMAELAYMNRSATAGEMTASIAHELNQPLAAILSNAETMHDLLARPNIELAKIQEIVSDIIEEDTRASEVMKRIRKLLRKEESKLEIVDINQLVQSTLQLLRGELVTRNVAVETALGSDLPRISADPVQLQQVLLNVLMNAMEAMSLNAPPHRLVKVMTRARTRQIEAIVVDSGHGIAPEHQKQLFQPFFTTKERGLGLGLSICSKIVSAHGGTLSIENNADSGAKIVMALPARESVVAHT